MTDGMFLGLTVWSLACVLLGFVGGVRAEAWGRSALLKLVGLGRKRDV